MQVQADMTPLVLGMRVALDSGEVGEVAYLGPVEGKTGEWVGVRLDEPIGRNDGSVAGKRYFEAGRKCGVFTRSQEVVERGNENARPFDITKCTHSFVGRIKSLYYGGVHIGMGNRFEWIPSGEDFANGLRARAEGRKSQVDPIYYTASPIARRWLFILSKDRQSYHILKTWKDAEKGDGTLVASPHPVMWAAHSKPGKRHWRLERSHRVLDSNECNWTFRRHDVNIMSVWNVASQGCLSACHSNGRMDANRKEVRSWEQFNIVAERIFPSVTMESISSVPKEFAMVMTPYLSYQLPFRARIATDRFRR